MEGMCKSNKDIINLRDIEKDHQKLIVDLNKTLESFKKGNLKKPITYNDLKKFPLFEWMYLDPITKKVKIMRKNMHFKDHLNFDTIMKKGGRFSEHFHGDCIESTEILKGKVLDLVSADIYETNDVLYYGEKDTHDIIALEDTEFKVLFKKVE